MVNEYFGAASGAALGFIHGDVPGAVAGWRLGRAATRAANSRSGVVTPKKKMPPVTDTPNNVFLEGGSNKRARSDSDLFTPKRKSGRSMPRTPRSSRSSKRRTIKGRRRPKTRGRTVRREPKSENINSGNATRKKDVKRNKRVVKVSPKFRKAVKQALESKALKGVHTNRGFNKMDAPFGDQQNLIYFSWAGAQDNGNYFSPISVNDAASQLWKNKAPNPDPFANRNLNFSESNTVIHVVNSYVVTEFANMSHRTVWITIYECMYKSPRQSLEITGAVDHWQKCLVDDATGGIAKNGANGYLGTGIPVYTKLGATPGQTSNFSKLFKYTTRNIVLEPGQRFVHHIQGPKNTTYDYSKFFVNSVFQPWQPGKTVSCFAVMHTDLVTPDTGSGAGRYAIGAGVGAEIGGHYIAVDTKATFVLEMPEQVGFTYPATTGVNTVQDLNLKKRVYLDNVWTYGPEPPTNGVHRVSAENTVTDTHT